MTGLVDREAIAHEAPDRIKLRWQLVLFGALLLVLGFFIGWAGRGPVQEPAPDPGVVSADEGELTERQEQMIVFLREYIEAWQAEDGEAVSAMFTDNGRFTAFGHIYRSNDGTLSGYVAAGDRATKALFEPFLVKENQAAGFHTVGGTTYMNTMQFTSEGELLLVNHEVHYAALLPDPG